MAYQGVWIVGNNRFTSELLAYYLRQECGTKTMVKGDLSEIFPPENLEEFKFWLLLVDAGDQEQDALLGYLEKVNNDFDPMPTLALYNINPDSGLEKQALDLGVRGFIYPHENQANLQKILTSLWAGELWLSRERIVKCLLEQRPATTDSTIQKITKREKEILLLIREGMGNNEIADRLHISYHTVKTHVFRAFKKLGLANRYEASAWAAKHLRT